MAELKVKLEDLSLEEDTSGDNGESVDKRESGDGGAAKETKDPFPGDLCASEHKTDDDSYLHFMMWTVNGLRKKLQDQRFVDMIARHHVIFLLETKMGKDKDNLAADKIIPEEFVARHCHGIRSLRRDQYSQGLSLLYRKTLEGCIGIEPKKQSGIDSVWVTFKKEKFGMSSDVIVCSVYIPPGNTYVNYTVPEAHNYIVNELKEDTVYYSEKGKVFVCGCFNARILPVYEPGDVSELKPDEAKGESPDKRLGFRKNLVEYCKGANIKIANGEVSMDKGIRRCTHIQQQSKTIIDYLLAKEDNFEEIDFFLVGDLKGQQGHAPLCFDLSIPNRYVQDAASIRRK